MVDRDFKKSRKKAFSWCYARDFFKNSRLCTNRKNNLDLLRRYEGLQLAWEACVIFNLVKTFFRIAGTTFFDFEMRGGLGRVEIAPNEVVTRVTKRRELDHALHANLRYSNSFKGYVLLIPIT